MLIFPYITKIGTGYNNNNIPDVISQVGFGGHDVYATLFLPCEGGTEEILDAISREIVWKD